ncbi:MAG: hypothetical protein CSA31_00595 [Desulfobulbus propionicus]|nr:MAG: hypothetical protein CSA31_00595 [Desulfobulbus propionicus]
MEGNAELLRLEEIVDQLLARYSQLKADYHTLEETLRERDAECAELKSNLENLNSEQTAVSNRVSGLLDRISQWENEHVQEKNDSPGIDEGGQGSLFRDGQDN